MPRASAAPFSVPLAGRANVLLAREEDELPDTSAAALTPLVRAAVEGALARGETHYTDRPGLPGLRQQASSLLTRRFAIAADPKADIVITCGVTEARFVATQQLLAPGESVAAPVDGKRLFGAALLRGAVLSTEIAADTRLVYLTSSTPEAALRATLAEAPQAATILFEVDEAVSTFHPAQLPEFAARTATVGRLGSESWRLGYLLSPSATSPGMREFKQALTICSTNLSQWAALAALEAGEGAFEHARRDPGVGRYTAAVCLDGPGESGSGCHRPGPRRSGPRHPGLYCPKRPGRRSPGRCRSHRWPGCRNCVRPSLTMHSAITASRSKLKMFS